MKFFSHCLCEFSVTTLSTKYEINPFLMNWVHMCHFLVQAKWCEKFGCNVWQSTLCTAAAELQSSPGSHEPSHCLGFWLPAGNYWEDETAASNERLGASSWYGSEVSVYGCFYMTALLVLLSYWAVMYVPYCVCGWKLRSELLSNVPSWCINVFTGLHRRTLSMNFIKW